MTAERLVEFPSQGATLRGRLFLPAAAADRPAVVIMAHGFSATADGMVADQYAAAFCDAGLAVLLYDHRNFGRSGGEPRQQIDNWLQVIGYRDAIDFVTTLDDVDASRLAVWGDSKSGGGVLVAAAFDRSTRAHLALSDIERTGLVTELLHFQESTADTELDVVRMSKDR